MVRLVHSLFTSRNDWDDQFDGFEMGWPGFFEVLRVYLQHFADAKAAAVRASGMHDGTEAEVWSKLTEALGLAGANLDETRATSGGAPTLAGTVERVHQDRKSREIMLRLAKPADGIALIGTHRWEEKTRAAISIFFYGDAAEKIAGREQPLWAKWMTEYFSSAA